MWFDLYLAALLHLLGSLVFGHFERHTPMTRKLMKVVMIQGITVLLIATVGRPWSILWVLGMFGLGTTFHFWWTHAHNIHPITAEPKARYYALRGWSLD